ncbi:OmpA family protein [Pedobacter sp. SD-b]|uniref:OmpA family protein n=1 Tax=Pedobacter segetis TaxID=2793069 RepID=A0ABS1BLJ7_9SPHI|nr:OmpA family protein [Pedobacter segetis]MBK0383759.1 OmpA family protein [Pedobacter segetis]
MKTNKLKITALSLAVAFGVTTVMPACKSLTKTQKGAGIGAVAGGTIGALIGKKAGNTAVGAIIGGAIGGTAGAYIGRNMDKQAKEIEQTVPGAQVIPAGEGIIVKFDSGLLFEFGKASLSADAKQNINNLASSLNKYPNTNILVVGHTDNVGSDPFNMKLSEERAASVKNYAMSQGVDANRLKTEGKGETEPIASNDTDAGRAQNRRVEIVIIANDKMKAEAKQATAN